MNLNKYRVIISLLIMTMVLTAGCSKTYIEMSDDIDKRKGTPSARENHGFQAQSADGNKLETATIPFQIHENQKYVPLQELVNVLELKSKWNENTKTLQIGDNDVVYEVKVNSQEARKENEKILLMGTPMMHGGQILLPQEALEPLFREVMHFKVLDQQLMIYPSNPSVTKNQIFEEVDHKGNDALDFADDPLDPSGEEQEVWQPSIENRMSEGSTETLKSVDMNSVIKMAKQYLGVKYEFGAEPYHISKKFDCSSFTKMIYEAHGIELHRIARKQAQQGETVSRKNLRKGDLLFFYVPGRFKSDEVVGHVGIYIGNQKMIHASPEPKDGVQISDINHDYWEKTFLQARRVAN